MSTATYLYCLVHSPREPSLRDAPAGLPGAGRPRAIDAGGGLWLLSVFILTRRIKSLDRLK